MKISLPWPLPALVVWAAAWGTFAGLNALDVAPIVAALLATAFGFSSAIAVHGRWRSLLVAAGFPISLILSTKSTQALPGWAWLALLAALIVLYPLRTWRDAPLFPTPVNALTGLAALAPLGDGAQILDAGCGLGDGLRELRREYPNAALAGWEWSWPLRLACAWRCRFAHVQRKDIWRADWSAFQMVYVFQRPETMAKAYEKATRELKSGAWLVSLEFPVPGVQPAQALQAQGARPVWVYRLSPHPGPLPPAGEGARNSPSPASGLG